MEKQDRTKKVEEHFVIEKWKVQPGKFKPSTTPAVIMKLKHFSQLKNLKGAA